MEEQKKGRRLSGYKPDYVVFDLETTGLSPETDKIIEISAVRVRGGKAEKNFSTLVNPGRKIPAAASRVNGSTDAMVADAPVIEDALADFLLFIEQDILVGHNIHSFDMKFLYQALSEELGKELPNDYIDTLPMARRCLPQLRRHRLTDLAAHFRISTEGAHRALNDCRMNETCYERMGQLSAEAGGRAGAEAAAAVDPARPGSSSDNWGM